MDVSPRPVRTIHPLSDAYFIHTEMCLSRFISQKHILEAVKLPSLVFYLPLLLSTGRWCVQKHVILCL